ncbi:MAG: transposase [Planctomycetaceae bacterium]|nr:transposase [Planctomycetaceae bacterium]MCB9925449.1 transposase [Planctomycetaceae bacterium]
MANGFHAATRLVWGERIERFEQAGRTVAQFCAAEGVSTASFYQWRRKLRSGAPATPSLAKFVPVKLAARRQAESVTVMSVEFPGGVRVRLEVTDALSVQS